MQINLLGHRMGKDGESREWKQDAQHCNKPKQIRWFPDLPLLNTLEEPLFFISFCPNNLLISYTFYNHLFVFVVQSLCVRPLMCFNHLITTGQRGLDEQVPLESREKKVSVQICRVNHSMPKEAASL